MPGSIEILSPAPQGAPLEPRRPRRLLRALARRFTALGRLQKAAEGLPRCGDAPAFAAACLAALDVRVRSEPHALERIPTQGPLLLYANHPTGALEGLVLLARCGRLRPDLKILTTATLASLPQLAPLAPRLLPLDLSPGAAGAANAAVLRAALRHLRRGGALGIFPAGKVARWSPGAGVREQPWSRLLGLLAACPGTHCLPLRFTARVSPAFLLATQFNEALGTALLPHVLERQRGSLVHMRVGRPYKAESLRTLSHAQRTLCLRLLQESLVPAPVARERAVSPAPLAAPVVQEDFMAALAALPQDRVLAREGRYSVYLLLGAESPVLLDELTMRREEAFRALGEGSGKARDTDRYDAAYAHLVLVDEEAQALAGAYRACLVRSDAAHSYSAKNLYTAALFRYNPEFFRHCGNALELGRAFIRAAYQRDYAPLLLLWKGIGQLALRSGARTLFGPASMGLDYKPQSVDLLCNYLRRNHWHAPLATLVRGRKPRRPAVDTPFVRQMAYADINALVRHMENGRNLPILFKHYLQLGGRIVAFHQDAAFGTLDALLVVDLRTAPERFLRRYLGDEGFQRLRDGIVYEK